MLHGGRIVAKALAREDTSHLFTLCGGHIQHIYDGCLDEGIRVVDFRHEQAAGHAAEGWARATGKPGVAAVTAGPGVTDAVTAVANAFRGGTPMILIGGQGPSFFKEMGSLQEMDHCQLMRSITKWSITVPETRRIPDYIAMAFRKATTGVPGPVFLEMPLDILMNFAKESACPWPERYRTEAAPGGDPAYIQRAADLLAGAERPVAVVGTQWWWSPYKEEIRAFVEHFDLPVFLNGGGRGALPPSHDNNFRLCRSKALAQADVVLVFGTPWDFRLGYGQKVPATTKVVQIDLDPDVIGHNRGPEVGILGDTGLVMKQLVAAAPGASHPAWLARVAELEEARMAKMRPEMASDASPVNPLRFSKELAASIPDNATIVCDGGDIVGTAAKLVSSSVGGHWMDPGPLGTLGVGPSYAMAARLARPDEPVFVIYGDGSFGLNGFEYEAAVRQDIPFVGVMGNDACWTQIHRGQKQIFGNERTPATHLAYTRYDKIVEAMGGHGEYVEQPGEIRPAIERALESGKPALVNVKIGASDFRKGAISV
ncbi:MAG TPA: thiamine pyrophosphate-binding protein [Myxococcota bacterium]|nr:thiamine pyrophosphate-binding protein [Myxococcota bacterium]